MTVERAIQRVLTIGDHADASNGNSRRRDLRALHEAQRLRANAEMRSPPGQSTTAGALRPGRADAAKATASSPRARRAGLIYEQPGKPSRRHRRRLARRGIAALRRPPDDVQPTPREERLASTAPGPVCARRQPDGLHLSRRYLSPRIQQAIRTIPSTWRPFLTSGPACARCATWRSVDVDSTADTAMKRSQR